MRRLFMGKKIAQKGSADNKLKEELKEIRFWKSKEPKDSRVVEIAKHFASMQQWDLAMEAVQLVSDEKERNLLIADLIEGHLLPANENAQAKKFAKFLTPVIEIEPFVWLRIALAENDTAQALKIAERLPSPLSRNFAYLHIMETYFAKKEKNKVDALSKLILENVRTIYDTKSRSYVLRELALNLFLPNNEKNRAKEMAILIPDATIRTLVLNKISAAK